MGPDNYQIPGKSMITESNDTLLRNYLKNPESFWGESHRQSKKLIKARDKMKRAIGNTSEVEDWILNVTSKREFLPVRTLLIFNAGSSGSHWLQAMIKSAIGFSGCGEVYLPNSLQLKAQEDFRFIDAVQVVQAHAHDSKVQNRPIVNTTHSTSMLTILMKAKGVKSIFLVRDPVEIVLSRTYRKSEYRMSIAPTATDCEYLYQNIEFVERVYRSALNREFDLLVKYEDIRKDPRYVLAKIAEMADVFVADHDIDEAVEQYKAENVEKSVGIGNLYKGIYTAPTKKVVAKIESRLKDVSARLGYAQSCAQRS